MARPKTVGTLLKRARAFLDSHKWGKGGFYIPQTGAYCAVGALCAVAYGVGATKKMALDGDIPPEAYGERDDYYDYAELVSRAELSLMQDGVPVTLLGGVKQWPTSYNDRDDTTKEDILAMFDRAIEAAQARGEA